MSVYTSISQLELESFLSNYKIGELLEYQGISEGIENTNYFVTTTKGNYVLTLFEMLKSEELPFYIELMAFLNEHDVPSAHPIADCSNRYLQTVLHKPAILMQRLHGKSVMAPQLAHCREVGLALAKLHVVGLNFAPRQDDFRGQEWRLETGEHLLRLLAADDAAVLKEELYVQALQHYEDLPQGVIHADLFRDNILFANDLLTGILDFYNACNDSLLYDVAITVNDWCVNQNGELDFARARALCCAYTSIRPITKNELTAWPLILRTAALRFWLSRLWDRHYPKPGEMTFQKDPDEFRQILLARISEAAALVDMWH